MSGQAYAVGQIYVLAQLLRALQVLTLPQSPYFVSVTGFEAVQTQPRRV